MRRPTVVEAGLAASPPSSPIRQAGGFRPTGRCARSAKPLPTADGSGPDLCPALCSVHPRRHCRERRSRAPDRGLPRQAADVPVKSGEVNGSPVLAGGIPPLSGSRRRLPPALFAGEDASLLRADLEGELARLRSAEEALTWARSASCGPRTPRR